MKFQFYNQLVIQPDVQEIVQDLLPPIKTLENLADKLKNLSQDDVKSAAFVDVATKVERLINKHFPNLVHDYCKLSLEYRNTAIIKRETSNGQQHEYTARDILLKNLSKLIEEIHVVENNFNENYSHKLLVQNRVVNDLGVQKNLLEIETENVKSVSLKNNFDYKNFVKNNPIPTIEKQENIVKIKDIEPIVNKSASNKKPPALKGKVSKFLEGVDSFDIFTSSFLVTIICVLGGGTYAMYANHQNQIDVNNEARNIMELSSSIQSFYTSLAVMEPDKYQEDNYKNISVKKLIENSIIPGFSVSNGKYMNKFDGEYIIKPYKLEKAGDSYSIGSENLSYTTCRRLVTEVNTVFAIININGKVMKKKNHNNLSPENIKSACSLNKNNVEFVNR